MSEPKETADKTVRAAAVRKPLSLKRTVESGHVQQKFSHGRSKSVVVEKKKKRTLAGTEAEESAAAQFALKEAPATAGQRRTTAGPSSQPETQTAQARSLSEEERVARAKALAAAQVRTAEEERVRIERDRQAALAKPQPIEAREEPKEHEAPVPAGAEEAARPAHAGNGKSAARAEPQAPEVTRRAPASAQPPRPAHRAEESQPRPAGMTRPMIVPRPDRPGPKSPETAKPEVEAPKRTARPSAAVVDLGDEDEARAKRKGGRAVRSPVKGAAEARVRGKLTITNAFDEFSASGRSPR